MPSWWRTPLVLGGGLGLLLCALQAGSEGYVATYNGIRIFELGVLLACLLMVRQIRAPRAWWVVWGGLLGLGVLSSLAGAYPALSLKGVLLVVAALVAAPRLAGIRRGGLVALGGALFVLQLLWTLDLLFYWARPWLAWVPPEPGVRILHEAFILYGNPRFLNQFQSWMLPVASLLCLRLRGPRTLRWLCWALLLASWTQLWLGAGRGTLIGLTAGCMVAALLLGRTGRKFALLQVALAAGGAALDFLFFRLLSPAPQPASLVARSMSTSGRTPAWERAWEMFTEAPILGQGPESFIWAGRDFTHPHSFPLQLLSEWGALGTLFMGGLLLWGAWGVFRLRRHGPLRGPREAWLVALSVSTVAAFTHSLVSGVFVMPLSHLGGLVVLALWFRVAGFPRRPHPRGSGIMVVAALLVLVGAGRFAPDLVVPVLGPMAPTLETLEARTLPSPRFWGNGP